MKAKLISGSTLEELEENLNKWLGSLTVIENVQQFTIGTVDTATISMPGQQKVNYRFCFLIFYRIRDINYKELAKAFE